MYPATANMMTKLRMLPELSFSEADFLDGVALALGTGDVLKMVLPVVVAAAMAKPVPMVVWFSKRMWGASAVG